MVKTDLDNYSVMLNEVIKLCQKVKEIQDADLTLQNTYKMSGNCNNSWRKS